MKTKLLVLLACVTILTGCLVPSLNPLFEEKDLVSYSDLIGTWNQDGKDNNSWKFEKEGRRYKLTHVDEKKRTALFDISIGKIGTNVFMDVFPADEKVEGLNDFTTVHLVPAHTFAKIEKHGRSLHLVMLDFEWMGKTLKDKPTLVPHVMRGNYPVLTASTEELQKFVAKFAADTNAFNNSIDLQPKK